MISKPILKQSIKNNWKLWLIITIVASTILSGFIISYDAVEYAALAVAAQDTAFASLFSSATSLLGSLENFYKLIAVILGIVYAVFTANNLVVSEVDSGSMAYTLSTPIKRSTVIFTKSLYLILSTVLMYTIIAVVGLGVIQTQYKNVTGHPITPDIKSASVTLNHKETYVSDRLYLILDDVDALDEGARARDMDTDAYTIYLEKKIHDRAFLETADIITDERHDLYNDTLSEDEIEISMDELIENPQFILDSHDALKKGAQIHGFSVNQYHHYIQDLINTPTNTIKPQEPSEFVLKMVIDSSAAALDLSSDQINKNLTLIKNPKALEASTTLTGLSEDQIISMANHAMVNSALSVDAALDFDLEAYLFLSLGLMLLILAISSISFFASTLFNRANLSLALGGGIPFAFFLITMVQQLMDASDALKYLTLTSLFNTDEILASGEFGLGLIALLSVTLILYSVSNIIFVKKDLPL